MSWGFDGWQDPPTYEVEFRGYNRDLIKRLVLDQIKREQAIRRVRESLRRKGDR